MRRPKISARKFAALATRRLNADDSEYLGDLMQHDSDFEECVVALGLDLIEAAVQGQDKKVAALVARARQAGKDALDRRDEDAAEAAALSHDEAMERADFAMKVARAQRRK